MELFFLCRISFAVALQRKGSSWGLHDGPVLARNISIFPENFSRTKKSSFRPFHDSGRVHRGLIAGDWIDCPQICKELLHEISVFNLKIKFALATGHFNI